MPVHDPQSSKLTRRGGTTTMRNTTTPTANARTGDTARQRYYVGCWGAHFLKRSSHGHCMLPSLRAIWIDTDEFLGQPDEKSFRSADVAEPIRVLVLDHFAADKLCAVLAEPDERIVDVVHGKHDA